MAEALELGRQLCGTPLALYLHQDTELLVEGARDRIVERLLSMDRGAVAGAAGSPQRVLPWWAGGSQIGCVHGSSAAAPVSSRQDVALLDGVVLAQSTGSWPWRPIQGWHGYDAARCLEAARMGLPVAVVPELECRHQVRQKGARYHEEHVTTCRRLAAEWGLACAY